jgi:hypothetical protein
MLLTYGELPHPMPLHGSDLKRLMGIPPPAKERIVEAVFNDLASPTSRRKCCPRRIACSLMRRFSSFVAAD